MKTFLLYEVLMWKSDNYTSHITRDKLCYYCGIKKPDTISKHTNLLKKVGLLTKEEAIDSKRRLITYHLTKPVTGYTICMNELFRLPIDVIPFVTRLAYLRYNGTASINLTNEQIYKRLNISRNKFYELRKKSIDCNVLFETETGYVLNTEYFPVFKAIDKTTRDKINAILQMDNSFRGKKVLLHYYTDDFKNLKSDLNWFVDYCLAGCPGINQEQIEITQEYDL